MVRIKSLASIGKKYGDVTPGRAPYYKMGVEDGAVDWEGPTADAEPAYEAGVTQAIADKRFGRKVREAGTPKWRRKAGGPGANRYGEGVRAGVDDFQSGFAPYHGVIERVALSPRGARGDPGNYVRSKEIGDALHAERVRG